MRPKPGSRALGIAASDTADRSQLCGAVVRADRVVDDVVFETCTTGGTDATTGCCRLVDRLDRPDVRWLLVAGIAPAWFNIIDLAELAAHADRPVIAVSFENSDGLVGPLSDQFEGEKLACRLAIYRRLPPRTRIRVGSDNLFIRAVGIEIEKATEVVTAFTPEGSGRPEPVRVARLVARAGRQQFLDETEKTES